MRPSGDQHGEWACMSSADATVVTTPVARSRILMSLRFRSSGGNHE
jgi:hypothetical protein